MQPRKLTAAEVTFEVTIEADRECDRRTIRGSFGTDEPDLDDAQANEIIERLNSGDETAWCGVIVTAKHEGLNYEGHDSIWGVTLGEGYTAEVVAEHHGMREEALDDLNRSIAVAFEALNPLLEG